MHRGTATSEVLPRQTEAWHGRVATSEVLPRQTESGLTRNPEPASGFHGVYHLHETNPLSMFLFIQEPIVPLK